MKRGNIKYRNSDRTCSCGHLYSAHRDRPRRSCGICDCKRWAYSEIKDIGPTALVERLRYVLRRRYRENCPNCNRRFNLADLSQDYVDSRNVYRVTCQDCYEILVEVEGSPFDSSDGACDIIAALDKQEKVLERQNSGLKSLFHLTAASLILVDVPAIRM